MAEGGNYEGNYEGNYGNYEGQNCHSLPDVITHLYHCTLNRLRIVITAALNPGPRRR